MLCDEGENFLLDFVSVLGSEDFFDFGECFWRWQFDFFVNFLDEGEVD